MRLQVFMQDVTTVPQPAELKILDTAATCTNCGTPDWSSTVANQLTRSSYGAVIWDLYRNWGPGNGSTGPCPGFYGITHLMAAAWSTDAGQRIGAATEIEGGGGGGPTPPNPPSGLLVHS
jgi:hypothetical protein